MIISVIVAIADNNVIGDNNRIPWYLPADLSWFKKNTINKPIIMGRQTFISIGHPLPHRDNIVITRQHMQTDYKNSPNLTWVNSLKSALDAAKNANEVMIIGGSYIYKQALPLAHRLYLTRVYSTVKGDTFFPNYLQYKWQSIFEEYHPADEKNKYCYQFTILDRM